jgi:hypothetical protein
MGNDKNYECCKGTCLIGGCSTGCACWGTDNDCDCECIVVSKDGHISIDPHKLTRFKNINIEEIKFKISTDKLSIVQIAELLDNFFPNKLSIPVKKIKEESIELNIDNKTIHEIAEDIGLIILKND